VNLPVLVLKLDPLSTADHPILESKTCQVAGPFHPELFGYLQSVTLPCALTNDSGLPFLTQPAIDKWVLGNVSVPDVGVNAFSEYVEPPIFNGILNYFC
jgi:hypothetical protein